MARDPWTFNTTPSTIMSVTVTDGTTTVTLPTMVPTGGTFSTTSFLSGVTVTVSATGYNDVTTTVGTSSLAFTEVPATPTVAYLSDGTNTYEIEDSKARADIQTLLSNIYPVGSVYIGKMSTCPLASLIPNSTWTLVASDKVLQGSGTYTAGTSVNAGLPDFKAVFVNHARDYQPQTDRSLTPVSGAIAVKSNTYPKSSYPNVSDASAGNYKYDQTLEIRPSISNPIYGNSTTVQPPAYVVNVWERTA